MGLTFAQSASARTPTALRSRLAVPAAVSRTNPAGIVYVGRRGLILTNLIGSDNRHLTHGGQYPRWGPYGGRILYLLRPDTTASAQQLRLVAPNGRHDHLLRAISANRIIFDMAWAPGAGRIALVATVGNAGDSDVFIYRRHTDSLRRLHVNSADRFPFQGVDWSHDGRQLVFSAFDGPEGGNADLYTVAPDGSGLQQITATTAADEEWPRWSPDDSRILFAKVNQNIDCTSWIRTIAADGSDFRRVGAGCHSYIANWSPNGRRIAVDKEDPKRPHAVILTMALDGTKQEVIGAGSDASYRPR